MVAYTDNFDLPFQTDQDRPCDSPDVWCDFVDLLDTDLDGLDQILGRVDPAVPAARLRRFNLQTVNLPFGALINWEFVDVDTDNMVDFGASTYRIVPQRLGSYYVTAWAEVAGGGTAGTSVSLEITTGFVAALSSTSFTGGGVSDRLRSPGSGTYYLRSSTITRITSLDDPLFGWGVLLRIDDQGAVVGHGQFSAHWFSDRV